MPWREGAVSRLVARVRALLPVDWRSKPGERLRATTEAVSEFAQAHGLRPGELLDESVRLGRRKLEGLANQELAAAVKNFADAERVKIEAELQRRSLESKVRKEEAEARRVQAEARLAAVKAADAELEFLQKLKTLGVVLHRDEEGNLTVLRAPKSCDVLELAERVPATTRDDPGQNLEPPSS